jgi:hypothetical protein
MLLDQRMNINKIPNWPRRGFENRPMPSGRARNVAMCALQIKTPRFKTVESQLLQSISFNNLADYISEIFLCNPSL